MSEEEEDLLVEVSPVEGYESIGDLSRTSWLRSGTISSLCDEVSDFFQNRLRSTQVRQIKFAVVVAILGLVLFVLLIGFMQKVRDPIFQVWLFRWIVDIVILRARNEKTNTTIMNSASSYYHSEVKDTVFFNSCRVSFNALKLRSNMKYVQYL